MKALKAMKAMKKAMKAMKKEMKAMKKQLAEAQIVMTTTLDRVDGADQDIATLWRQIDALERRRSEPEP